MLIPKLLENLAAPKSSASPTADFVLGKILKMSKQKVLDNFQMLKSLVESTTQNALTATLVNKVKNSLDIISLIKIKITYSNVLHLMLLKCIVTALVILLAVSLLQV